MPKNIIVKVHREDELIKFEPELWDEKHLNLDNLLFAKAFTRSFFYMPLNMGKVMTDSMKLIVSHYL